MRVLVTGGGGYIGSVAVERLLDQGHDVTVIDNFWRGHRSAVAGGAHCQELDLRDRDATFSAVKAARPEAIMHFAAATLVPESVVQPADYFDINLLGGLNLFDAARDADVNKIVFSSTAAVYGEPAQLPIPESAPTIPINPYGQSKLTLEQILASYSIAYDLRYAALRYFNVAGATKEHGEDHRPETHVIPVALLTLRENRPAFRIFGTDYQTPDGTAIRDYVHVVDLVDAHLLALHRLEGASIGPVNLGTKHGFSVSDIVDAIEVVTRQTLPVEYHPRREGDPPALIADSTRATNLLGWTPHRSSLTEMIGSTWDWMHRYPTGYGR